MIEGEDMQSEEAFLPERQGPARRRRGSCLAGNARQVPQVDCRAWNMQGEPIPTIEGGWKVIG